jgi:23S rRNA (adenine2030-N6)-methyltransferase
MNYRHHYHAGNFADVMKHALLVQLLQALQKKEKGFLFCDTHAGRGCYDLEVAGRGDSLARKPEWPDGIGRLWREPAALPALDEYLEIVRRFDRDRGNAGKTPRFYPGSPWIARLLLRPQDRLVLCEKHPEEHAALAEEFQFAAHAAVHNSDGYAAIRALLPPKERRALVLIDPPFEAQDEFAQIAGALREGLQRLAGGTFAVWYPLTERAKVDAFFRELAMLRLPPTAAFELTIAGDASALKLRGCGVVVVNPPWQFDRTAEELLSVLSGKLAQEGGARAETVWLVPER